MPKADFVVSIILMSFGIWIMIHSYHMPRFEELGADPFSVPGIVPGILGLIIFVLSLVVFIRSLYREGYRLGLTQQTVINFVRDAATRRMLLTTLICIVYGLGMVGNMNYYLATFVFVLAFLLLFQYRPAEGVPAQKKMLALSLIQAGLTAGIVGAVFRYLFLVDLP